MATAVVVIVSVLVALALRDGGGGGAAGDEAEDVVAEERDDEPLARAGSAEVDDDGVLAIGEEPDAYRITYAVNQRGGGPEVEELTVLRPFWSEVVTSDEDGEVLFRQRWSFGRVHTVDGPVFAVGPSVPGSDLRPGPALDAALEADLLERREWREVAGRRCQVHRAHHSVVGGTLSPPAEDSPEHADVCIDASGLVLEEWWVVDGDAIRQRVATSVVESVPADFGDDWIGELPSMATDQGGGSILRVRDDSAPPGPVFTAPAPPATGPGFVHLGRFSVIPPQADAFSDATGRRGSLVTSTADVWRRGIDVVVVDQGGTLGGVDVYAPDPDNRIVELPNLGAAEVVVSLVASEIRVQRPGGKFVRVLGTLAPDDLLAFARTLVEGEGSELVILEDEPLPQP